MKHLIILKKTKEQKNNYIQKYILGELSKVNSNYHIPYGKFTANKLFLEECASGIWHTSSYSHKLNNGGKIKCVGKIQ
jgi:hypothetical protein